MADPSSVTRGDPSPYRLQATDKGPACLLVHGLTGSPAEMRPLGTYLHAHGVSVSAPLLPGHGVEPERLNRVTWRDWMDEAERALTEFLDAGRPTFAAGLSMGTLIVAELAVRRPELRGIILYAPALCVTNRLTPLSPLLRRIIASVPKGTTSDLSDPSAKALLWHYDCWPSGGVAEFWSLRNRVKRRMPSITTPALVFHSTQDATVAQNAGRVTYNALGSRDKELVTLAHSGHVMIVDIEKEAIFAQTLGFVTAHLPRAAELTCVAPSLK